MKKWGKLAIPGVLVLLGLGLRGSNATSFLGLVCWTLAGLAAGYFLLAWLKKRCPRGGKVGMILLTAVIALGLVLVTATGVVVAGAMSGKPEQTCDYIVVLGAKVNGTEPSRSLRERIDAACAYLNAHPETVAVLSGGQGSDEGISEAACMYRELVERGISPERLRQEDRATSTWENLRFSLELIQEETGSCPERLGLVSSEFHLYRAGLFAKQCGVEAVGIPAKTGNALYFANYFLREIAGVWHSILLGGLYQ